MRQLKKILNGLIDTRSFQLSNGAAKDFADYKTITGQISGLRSAIFEIDDLLEKQRKADGNESS